jgi:hypothetical protein
MGQPKWPAPVSFSINIDSALDSKLSEHLPALYAAWLCRRFLHYAFLVSDTQHPEEGIVSGVSLTSPSLTSSILTPQQFAFLLPNNRLNNPSFFSSVIFLSSIYINKFFFGLTLG